MENCLDCMIIVPPFLDGGAKHDFSNKEMLGPEYIVASALYNGMRAEFYNGYSDAISAEYLLEKIIEMKPSVLGISCSSQRSYIDAKDFIDRLELANFNGVLVLGGFYASLEYYNIMNDIPSVDMVVIGEGEFTFVEIVKRSKTTRNCSDICGIAFRSVNKISYNAPIAIQNLDFPFTPNRQIIKRYAVSNMIDGVNIPGKYYNMNVGRGCYGRCSFCSICEHEKSRKRRYRSPDNIIKEIEKC